MSHDKLSAPGRHCGIAASISSGGVPAPAPARAKPARTSPSREPRAPRRSRLAAAAAPLLLLLLLVILPVLGAAGCGRRQSAAAPPAPRGPAGADKTIKEVEIREDPVKTGIEAGDAGLAARVRSRLAADPVLRGLRLEVDAEGGRVTLWGRAERAEERAAAEELARRTPGVTSVIDLVKIDSPAAPQR